MWCLEYKSSPKQFQNLWVVVGNRPILGPLRGLTHPVSMLPRTKRSFKISESSVDETSLRGQRCDPSVKLNRFHRNKFLVFSHAVMIVNLFESFCCHLKCLSLIMALFLYNPWNNVLKSPNRKSEMRILKKFILDSFEDVDPLPIDLSRYLIKSLPLVKMLVFDSGTSGWPPYQWRGPSPRSLTQRGQKMGNHDL